MSLFKATKVGFDGVAVREVGEIFEFNEKKMVPVEKIVDGKVVKSEQAIGVGSWMEFVEKADKAAHEKAHEEQAKAGATQKGKDLRSQNDVNALAGQKGRQDVI